MVVNKKRVKKRVLFLCKNNSGRSQMAEGLLKHLYSEYYDVYSAGSDPKEVNPLIIEVMGEIGIDISNNMSKHLRQFQKKELDYVITLCDIEEGSCPVPLQGKNFIHQSFKDPGKVKGTAEYKLAYFRELRDEIKGWIEGEFGLEVLHNEY